MYQYPYPRPSVTVDIIVFDRKKENVLLIERKNEPFKNSWALPGGFVDKDEALDKAAYRELEEETGIRSINLKQFYTFGNPGRDPRGHTVSIVYWGIIQNIKQVRAGDDALNTKWFSITVLPKLAFDHLDILNIAIEELI